MSNHDSHKTRNVVLAAIATSILIGGVAALIFSSSGGGSSSAGAATAPAPGVGWREQLAANDEAAGRVIDGHISTQLAALKGVPVVVNQWASWCPSCKAEFGFFAEVAEKYRGKVAFLGLDSEDDRGSADAFLKDHPVSYPSIFDRSADQAASIGGGQSWPTTIFYNAEGKRTFVRPGGYVTAESLDNDVREHALADRP